MRAVRIVTGFTLFAIVIQIVFISLPLLGGLVDHEHILTQMTAVGVSIFIAQTVLPMIDWMCIRTSHAILRFPRVSLLAYRYWLQITNWK